MRYGLGLMAALMGKLGLSMPMAMPAVVIDTDKFDYLRPSGGRRRAGGALSNRARMQYRAGAVKPQVHTFTRQLRRQAIRLAAKDRKAF